MAEKFLAEYFRLSVEDGDVVLDDTKAESDKIGRASCRERVLVTV